MDLLIGERIREQRVLKRVSQEQLAAQLRVSAQAVSKWENGVNLPDIALIPVMAEYFGVSTDELFGMDRLQRESRIEAICREAFALRSTDPKRAEQILRDGLRRFPGDSILLNNLLYTLTVPERNEEIIEICHDLVQSDDGLEDVRCDAWRILAVTYAAMGETRLARMAVEHIPELYFTKLEVAAELLEGEEALDAARRQRNLSAELLVRMLDAMATLQREQGDEREAEASDALRAQLLALLGELPYPFGDGTLREHCESGE